MTRNKITKEQVRSAYFLAEEALEIEAILRVNCHSDRALGKLGIEYDEKTTINRNLVIILEKLIFMIAEQKKEAVTNE